MAKELTIDQRGKLTRISADVLKAYGRSVDAYIETGEELARGQAVLEASKNSGAFGEWLASFPFSKKSGYRMIAVFDHFGEHRDIAGQFDATALITLSEAKCPAKARKKAIKEASKGVKITTAKADELVKEFTVESGHCVTVTQSDCENTGENGTFSENAEDSTPQRDHGKESGENASEGSDAPAPRDDAESVGTSTESGEGVTDRAEPGTSTPGPTEEGGTEAQWMTEQNHSVESFCRAVRKLWDETIPDDAWSASKGKLAESHLDSCLKTMRAAKCAERCPKCKTGCEVCKFTAYMPTREFTVAGGRK